MRVVIGVTSLAILLVSAQSSSSQTLAIQEEVSIRELIADLRLAIQTDLPSRLYMATLWLPPPLTEPLTPKLERIDGWTTLFDGSYLDSWRPPTGSKWHVVEGLLYPEGNKPALLVSRSAYENYELSVVYHKRIDSVVRVFVNCDADGNSRNTLAVLSGDKVVQKDLDSPRLIFKPGVWVELRVEVVNGRPRNAIYRASGSETFQGTGNGRVKSDGLQHHIALMGSGVLFRSIKVRRLNKEGRP